MTIRGKVAIITGAGKGIGRGIARAYASEGAKLVLVSRTLAQVEDAAERGPRRRRGGVGPRGRRGQPR